MSDITQNDEPFTEEFSKQFVETHNRNLINCYPDQIDGEPVIILVTKIAGVSTEFISVLNVVQAKQLSKLLGALEPGYVLE